jgi:hypothetical protein
MPQKAISDEIDRLAREIYRSRKTAPDDFVALYARHELWFARERLRLELKDQANQDA